MSMIDGVLEKLEPFVFKDSGGQEIQLWCPYCDDRQTHNHGHGYINRNSLFFHCVFCGRGSKDIRDLLKAYNIEMSYVDKITMSFSGSSNLQVILSKTDGGPQLEAFIKESKPMNEGSWGHDYLVKKRGMMPQDVARYWRVWDKKPGYVFWFTSDEHGVPIFFSGRSYIKGVEPKYYHLSASPPVVLFHPSSFIPTPAYTGRSLVFIVEGIFDAFFAPGPSIPLFAKKLSNKMHASIKKSIMMNNLSPVAALDRDEIDDNLELASQLQSWCEETYIFKMGPCKDFGENKMSALLNIEINKRLIPFSPHIQNLIALQLKS